MKFEDKLHNYAQLLIEYGICVYPGQIVEIFTEPYHRNFALILAEMAYNKGAKYVGITFLEPKLTPIRINGGKKEDLTYVSPHLAKSYNDLIEECGACLRIIGPEEPDLLENVDSKKLNLLNKSFFEVLEPFYIDGIGRSKIHWTIASAATPQWAKKIFPRLPEKEAEMALWEQIFKICRADKINCIQEWEAHDLKLVARSQWLNSLKIKTLHFIGPGTDLQIGLSAIARFTGGRSKSAKGFLYEPNIPTEECFTTPDFRKTEGHVKTTRPFLVNGKLMEGLALWFKAGEVVKFKADKNEDTFAEFIETDKGSKFLGEVALVGIDSPVYQSGLVFQEILYDENAASHIAIGLAYKKCLENGENLSKEELDKVGCNVSSIHRDMMISSEEVDVFAETYDGTKMTLIQKGCWKS